MAHEVSDAGRADSGARRIVKSVLRAVVRSDTLWQLVKPVVVDSGQYLAWQRFLHERKTGVLPEQRIVNKAIGQVFPTLVVAHGPFAGMQYPALQSAGSQLFPKLLGSYERELGDVIETICATPYAEVINVGCGEGYYAVGLARRLGQAHVHAFDLDSHARQMCEAMAVKNGVASRISIQAACDAAWLIGFRPSGRSLLICDCEGCELNLFSERVVAAFAHHDVLIEVHNFVDLGTSAFLKNVFANTHHIESFTSIDDIRKAETYDYTELARYSLKERRVLLSEDRPNVMEWLFFRSKSGVTPTRSNVDTAER